jgi:hypothetical protein
VLNKYETINAQMIPSSSLKNLTATQETSASYRQIPVKTSLAATTFMN